MVELAPVLADLHDESASLDALLVALPAEQWQLGTPAAGWTIAHQIAHLAWTDSISIKAATDPDAFADLLGLASREPDAFVDAAAEAMSTAHDPHELLGAWRDGRRDLADTLAALPSDARIMWFGPPMSAVSMATARLMETWAHGQDVADALDLRRAPTPRLRHVAHLGVRTRDFAFLLHGRPVPDAPFRVELVAPSGELWAWGPDDATQQVGGSALDFCLLVTQRRHRGDLGLTAHGVDADAWLDIAQAFAGPPGRGREPSP